MLSFKRVDFFSKTEKIIVSLLIISFLIGAGVNLYKNLWRGNQKLSLYETELNDFEKDIAIILQKDSIKQTLNSKIAKKIDQKKLSIDVNKATKKEFEQLPCIGPVIAQRIIDYREQIGRFKTLDELLNIKGIGNKTFNKFKLYIKIVQHN